MIGSKFFFSEEKKQKTFKSALADRYGIWPDGWVSVALQNGFNYPAKSRIFQPDAGKQKSFGSFLQKRTRVLRVLKRKL
jgi:hypothetical protein